MAAATTLPSSYSYDTALPGEAARFRTPAPSSYDTFPGGGYPTPPPLNAGSWRGGPPTLIGKQPSEHSLLRSGGSGHLTAPTKVNTAELIAAPWLLLVLVLVCFLQAGSNGYLLTLAVVPTALVGLALAFVKFHYARANHAEVVLGLLCLTAVMIGTAFGTYAVARSLVEFHRLNQGMDYTNVMPTEPAASKIDASTISFTDLSRVDVSRTFGLTDARSSAVTGSVYCVAPVSDGSPYERRVEFWAVGVNCCEPRSHFACFPRGNGNVQEGHGGFAYAPGEAARLQFAAAVRGAEAFYGVSSGEHAVFLQWQDDPVAYREGLLRGTVTLFAVVGGSYLLISAMIGTALVPVVLGPKMA